jgi:thiamine-monophosphate kinase
MPQARLRAGALLAREKLARAMIDVSDGLVQDLTHLCRASKVGAVIWEASLPLSRAYRLSSMRRGTMDALTGGEDYELLFSLRPRDRARLKKVERSLGVPVTRIGECLPESEGVRVLDPSGKQRSLPVLGYDHFRS